MTTKVLTINATDWTQLTSGTDSAVVQITFPVHICRADSKPAEKNQPKMTFEHTTMAVTAPDKAWIKSAERAENTVVVW